MNLHCAVVKAYQKRSNPALSTSRWPGRTIRSPPPAAHRADGYGNQHPFGNQATGHYWPALGFASQPCGWFALSRMMTLQALWLASHALRLVRPTVN